MKIIYAMVCAVLCVVMISLYQVPELQADLSENYEETRIHSKKIDARLKDWIHRAKSHAKNLENSDHKTIARWRTQMQHIKFKNEFEELQHLNRIINSDVVYRDDYTHFHKKDFWADPETTLEEGGDCEDIALLKAASLIRLKWPHSRMHLLVGYLTERGKAESHAVLLVENIKGEQLILRSITNEVVRPGHFQFVPIYAVDGEGTIIIKPPEEKQT
ncbi:transglutaminase-like cysteine peptidase [Desulforhopalus sp. 52FAK]